MNRNGSKPSTSKAPAKQVRLEVALSRAVRRVKRMSRAELRQSLVDAGIVGRSGKLTPMYR
ncbi:MAG TPA: hypothetical protein VN578_01055 [Candidatus Binatia bacterium]|nr:hypothetical protein [Candidatus Binatia bacterium]